MPTVRQSPVSRWRVGGIALFCVSGFLLLTMGGAIVAAPLTVPLMVLTVRRQPTTAFRAIGALLAGLTIAEVVWALAYLMAGESSPWIWLVPMAAAAATVVAMWTSANTADRSPAPA